MNIETNATAQGIKKSHKGHLVERRKPTAFEKLAGVKYIGDNAYCEHCDVFFRE